MDMGIQHRVAMVAAASKGLGQAAARALALEGCRVSICARDPAALETARGDLAALALDGAVLAVRCDVSRGADLSHWFQATTEALGGVDILVTNTGGPPAATFLDLTEEQWDAAIQATLMNVVRLCRLVLPGMRARRWGRIVHLTSLTAKQPQPLLTLSGALRAGISALTRTMATEFGPDNVLVNAVLPGHILTDRQLHLGEVRARKEGITPERYLERAGADAALRRFGRAEEVGDVVAFLCGERAGYLTGVSLPVDGGMGAGTF
ncbi:MAG: SDR family oxidoreductase [Holophaga sp.]|jgi:3-oxoacyl-[acyl-carrier protein] reductase